MLKNPSYAGSVCLLTKVSSMNAMNAFWHQHANIANNVSELMEIISGLNQQSRESASQ